MYGVEYSTGPGTNGDVWRGGGYPCRRAAEGRSYSNARVKSRVQSGNEGTAAGAIITGGGPSCIYGDDVAVGSHPVLAIVNLFMLVTGDS